MRARKISFIAILTAAALTIFLIEAQIPPLVPIPGVKLGLANIITLIALATLGKKEAFLVLILRIVLGSVFAGSIASGIYSLSGGVACFLLMASVLRLFGQKMLWCVSIIGALGHNIGQIAAAILFTQTLQVAWYLPVLAISAVITGTFTGIVAQLILKYAGGIIRKMINTAQ